MTRTRQQRRTKGVRDAETRGRLLDAARTSVAVLGIQGATSRDITARAGANLAAITYHFGSKDELVTEALFDELRGRIEPAVELLADDSDPTAAMLDAVDELMGEFERGRRDAPAYLAALVEATRPGPARTSARRLLRRVRGRLAARMSELQAASIVPAWVDPEAMAALIVAVANGVVLQAAIEPRAVDARAVAGQFAGLLTSAGAGR